MKEFDREAVFAAVDESNKRFETYTDEQRKQFRDEARSLRETIGAPQWLKDRMEALKKLPPPTIEKVRAQWKASAEFGWENPYKNVNYIR